MFGPRICTVCIEKQRRIDDLLDQIAHLRKLVFTPEPEDTAKAFNAEMDNLLGGSDDPIQIPPDQDALEAARILTGDYDNTFSE